MAYTTINKSTDYFNTKLYTGTGSSLALTGVNFQPDLVWGKKRSESGWHHLIDSVRGVTKVIYSNEPNAEETSAQSVTSFDSDGFTLGTAGGLNTNNATGVAWNWKANGQGSSNTDGSINTTYTSANTTAGFSISTYTGNGTAGATVGHGLGVVPSMIIVKIRTGDNNNWGVYHKDMGETNAMYLDQQTAKTSDGWMNNTAPTNQVFSLSGGNYGNVNNYTYVAYCFAEKTGYSKFGSYTGNASSNGTFIYTGFRPTFLLVKRTDTADWWGLFDDKREGFNADSSLNGNDPLFADDNSVEGGPLAMDLLSNGFKWRTSNNGVNGSGGEYIYMAFGQSIVGSNNIPCVAR